MIGSVFLGAGAGMKAAMSPMPTPKWTAPWSSVRERRANAGVDNSIARGSFLFLTAFRAITSNIWRWVATAFFWVMAVSITDVKRLRRPITRYIFGAGFTHRLACNILTIPATTATAGR